MDCRKKCIRNQKTNFLSPEKGQKIWANDVRMILIMLLEIINRNLYATIKIKVLTE